jgi:hypothetical protein
MRSGFLALTISAILTAVALPAQAAWHSYAAREAGFSFEAPGDVKTDRATYRSAAGQRAATVYRSLDDNIEYKVTVVDFAGRANDEPALIKEAAASLQNNRKVLADAEARVEQSYGRKMTFELPNNGGRSMAAVYISRGHLIQLEVTVLPANGDYASPDLGRFVDSIAFNSGSSDPDKIELQLVK